MPMHIPPHRPYEVQPPAPTSRTFWNHYETGLLVDLWLEFEPQFLANKRNAGVWAQLAQRLTDQSGRLRTVRECRIKWKNMWAKHRDLANATHMSPEAKLREFPHFAKFSAIKRRGSQQGPPVQQAQGQPPHANDSPETSRASLTDERRMSYATELSAAAQALAVSSSSSAGGLPLEQILAAPEGSPQPPRRHSGRSPGSIYDIPHMLRRLDRALDGDGDGDGDRSPARDAELLSVGSVVEQIQALAGSSAPADVACAVQQVMRYMERESQRRQRQSERHHMVAVALTNILAQSGAGAPESASTSRRSSGVLHEWLPAHAHAGTPPAPPGAARARSHPPAPPLASCARTPPPAALADAP
ncbi:hypothetical protein H4R18_004375 [Coemansia javaensis]|uniref:Myb-like domain-containing protein n=1 Tax=Coemansia javaensis TaxID=2761396 RepID=A0A9W8LH74_9FUNG|nr:hypothetical protein H4R18_004375 [Coemansia javaensis]